MSPVQPFFVRIRGTCRCVAINCQGWSWVNLLFIESFSLAFSQRSTAENFQFEWCRRSTLNIAFIVASMSAILSIATFWG